MRTEQSRNQHGPHLRRDQAARYLGISRRKLDALAADGHLPVAKIGRVVLYRRVDLDQFIRDCMTASGVDHV